MLARFVDWYGSNATHLVLPHGIVLAVAAAMLQSAGALPGGWWTVGAALLIPKAIWAACAIWVRLR